MNSTSEQSLANIIVGIILLILAILLFTAGAVGGMRDGIRQTQKEAVLKGAAEYVVDESGNPVFQWKESK